MEGSIAGEMEGVMEQVEGVMLREALKKHEIFHSLLQGPETNFPL